MGKKAMIAMSGGVDSSVAAYLIKKAGYDAIGVTLKLYENEDAGIDREKTCCSLEDVEDARSVAYKMDMPYYVFNYAEDFRENVMNRFVCAYESGATPNPCIDCNRYIKFAKLLSCAETMGIDYVVTGHYAKVEKSAETGRFLLKKAADTAKDQSYVLYTLTQEQLARVLFPLGEFKKGEVRAIAEENGFVNAKKHDSQDICFVPDGDYAAFIERYTGKHGEDGDFLDTAGNVIGRHRGVIRYTIGQRKGLGAFCKPMYVCAKDPGKNTVILGENSDLFTSELTAGDVNLISVQSIEGEMRVKAKVRYRQAEQWATVTQTDKTHVRLVFDQPQRAIAKGQAVVFYDGDCVVGGGTIE